MADLGYCAVESTMVIGSGGESRRVGRELGPFSARGQYIGEMLKRRGLRSPIFASASEIGAEQLKENVVRIVISGGPRSTPCRVEHWR